MFIILARLLTPEDFGLVGMLMLFFAISQTFVDSGLGHALIRERKITDQARATVFWFNLLLSVVFYILLFFAAPTIAEFYEQPELVDLTRVMGLSILFFGLAIIQRSEMSQQLEFRKQAYAQVPAMLIAGTTSIIMAYIGFGVWALVAQYVLLAFYSCIFLWLLHPVRISMEWSRKSFTKLFGFGYKLLLSGLLRSTFQNIYYLIIGKFFSVSIVGFYTQAQNIQRLVSQNLVGIIQKVTYPLLSKVKENPERLKRGYRKVIQTSSFIIFPGMILLILLAEPIIILLLGEQWSPAVPILQILCFSGMFFHIHAINLNILKVLGRSDIFLKMMISKKVIITFAIIVGLQFDIYGLLIVQGIASFVALLFTIYFTSNLLNYSFKEQAEDVFKVLLLSFPMVIALGLVLYVFPANSLLLLVLYITGSGVFYLGGNYLYRSDAVNIVIRLSTPYMHVKLKNLLHL